jgi:ribosome-binding protein aMBF1 (putative translation factor)
VIKNERQYRITKAQAKKFAAAIGEHRESQPNPSVHPLLVKAQEDAMRSELEALEAQIAEYEVLKSGNKKALRIHSLADLPKALIQARIASGLSQKQLASRLGLAEQQVQQYEANEFASTSFSRLQEIARALHVSLVSADLKVSSDSANQVSAD